MIADYAREGNKQWGMKEDTEVSRGRAAQLTAAYGASLRGLGDQESWEK